jgi:hypothetical protein
MKTVTMWQLKGAIRESAAMLKDCSRENNCSAVEIKNIRNTIADLRAMKLDLIKGNVADVRAKLKKIRT